MPFSGTRLLRFRPPSSYSSSSSSRLITTLFVHLLPLKESSRRSNLLLLLLLPEEPESISGRYERPQSNLVKRGRRLGRQADTTPMEGSADVQRAGWTKLPGDDVRKMPPSECTFGRMLTCDICLVETLQKTYSDNAHNTDTIMMLVPPMSKPR